MDEFGSPRFEGAANTIRKKRSLTSRRPRPESQPFTEICNRSPLSLTPPSDDVSKVSSDENTGCDANSRRKLFHINRCASRGAEGQLPHKNIKVDGGSNVLYSNGGFEDGTEQGRNGLNHKQFSEGVLTPSRHVGVIGDGVGNENTLKKVKLKVGGVTRTIQTKSSSQSVSGSGSSTKSARSSDVPRPRKKLILQDNSDEDHSPNPYKKSGLQGIPWKDFSRGHFSLGKEDSLMGRMPDKNPSRKQGEKSEQVRKRIRVSKRRVLDGAFDDDDDDEDEDDEI